MEIPTGHSSREAEDLSAEPWAIVLRSVPLLPLVAVCTLLPFWARWGVVPLVRGELLVMNPGVLLAGLLAFAPLHEGLHALGFLLGGVPPRALRFGLDVRTASVLIHCRAPVSIEVFRLAVVLPFLALSLVPVVWSWGTGTGWLALAAMFSTAAATGDLLVLWRLRGIPADRRVADHPSRVGCRLLPRGAVLDHRRP